MAQYKNAKSGFCIRERHQHCIQQVGRAAAAAAGAGSNRCGGRATGTTVGFGSFANSALVPVPVQKALPAAQPAQP
jgi:hypothetical protein